MLRLKFNVALLSLVVAVSTSGAVFATEISEVDLSSQTSVLLGETIQSQGAENVEPIGTVVVEGTTLTEDEEAEEAPALEEPVVEEAVEEAPALEEPVVEEPVEEAPALEKPVVEEIVEEEIVEEAPVLEEPVVEEPIEEAPALEEPVVEEPVEEAPALEEPVVEEIVEEAPALEEPVVEEIVEEIPVLEAPIVEEIVEELPVEEAIVEKIECTLSILHVFESGDVYCEDKETREALMTGETVRFGDYTYEDTYEFAKCVNADETAELVEDENQIVIRYTLKEGYYIAEDEKGYYVAEEE